MYYGRKCGRNSVCPFWLLEVQETLPITQIHHTNCYIKPKHEITTAQQQHGRKTWWPHSAMK